MKRFYLLLIFCLFLFTGCRLTGISPVGPIDAQSGDQNIKIYTDSDVNITPDKIVIDDTTIFYIKSSATQEDMEKIKSIFKVRYHVYEGFFMK